jgi:23S rRNA-intervening sequence protein
MTQMERFEDLKSWQKARQRANVIYDLTDHPGFAKVFQLRNQIRDAAGSAMHNLLPDAQLQNYLTIRL